MSLRILVTLGTITFSKIILKRVKTNFVKISEKFHLVESLFSYYLKSYQKTYHLALPVNFENVQFFYRTTTPGNCF